VKYDKKRETSRDLRYKDIGVMQYAMLIKQVCRLSRIVSMFKVVSVQTVGSNVRVAIHDVAGRRLLMQVNVSRNMGWTLKRLMGG